MGKIETLKGKIKYLKESPIFAMSLGSKELFHSNFWQWLMCRDIDTPEQTKARTYASIFFEELANANIVSIGRESKHRDLTIVVKDGDKKKEYVIENKMKSMPDKQQLLEYSCEKGCIVSMLPKLDFTVDKWEHLQYIEVVKKIEEKAKQIEKGFDKWVILKYVEVLRNINDIVNNFNKLYENEFYHYEKSKSDQKLTDKQQLCKDLHELRIDDLCKKLNAENFKERLVPLQIDLEQKLKELGGTNRDGVFLGTWFSNNDALVEINIDVNGNTKEEIKKKAEFLPNYCSIGIQIQHGQYRFRVRRVKNNPKQSTQEIFEEFKECGWFEDYKGSAKGKSELLFGHQSSMSGKYCKYGDDVVYQYYNIGLDEFSFDGLVEEITKDMQKAMDIMKKHNLYR